MLVVQDAYASSDLPHGVVATIGNFDGVHCGQRAILERVVAGARAAGVPAAVITFDPHPFAVLRPEQVPPRLTTREQKEKLLAELGIDVTLVVRFTPELAKTPADRFVRDFLAERLGVVAVWVGAGFTFGHGRQGNLALLTRLGEELGFATHGVDEVFYKGERLSSSRIRRAVTEGRIVEANEMLGRPYAVAGVIARGDRMGKRLGWPTINLVPENELLPADGVYAGQVFFQSFPATFECAINIGTRPTVYENYQRVVESHILDFKSDVYGERVELRFWKQLREERIFPTVMDLSSQIGRDVESTREFFARRRAEQGAAPE